jgi:hypothetical protein
MVLSCAAVPPSEAARVVSYYECHLRVAHDPTKPACLIQEALAAGESADSLIEAIDRYSVRLREQGANPMLPDHFFLPEIYLRHCSAAA